MAKHKIFHNTQFYSEIVRVLSGRLRNLLDVYNGPDFPPG